MSAGILIKEYDDMIDAITNKRPFTFEKNLDGHKVEFKNSNAGCDFSAHTKKGDYIVLWNYSVLYGNFHSCGGPYEIDDFFNMFPTYEDLIDDINKAFTDSTAPQYRKLEYNLQMSLF